MRISVCLPVFGREKMLQQAIHSVLLQEHEDWEIVIRDDDPKHPVSSNPEVQKLFDFLGPRLKYVIERHVGTFSGVANGTVQYSTGEIIHIMGSDDVLAPSALYIVNQTFQERYDSTTRGPMWAYGKTLSTKSHLQFDGTDGEPITYEHLLHRNSIGCPSVFWNRSIMNLVGRFDPRFKWAADYDMWLRFFECVPPVFINQELGIYRHHDNRMSAEHTKELEREAKKVSWRHTAFRDILGRAHKRYAAKFDYDGEPIPLAHDDLG